MTTHLLKNGIIGLSILLSNLAGASANLVPAGTLREFYINNVSTDQKGTCYTSTDSRMPRPYYFYLFVSNKRGSYDPANQQRVMLWTDDCNRKIDSRKLEGQKLILKLQTNRYSSSWDLEIANYATYDQMVSASKSVEAQSFDIERAGQSDFVVQLGQLRKTQNNSAILYHSTVSRMADDFIILNETIRSISFSLSGRWFDKAVAFEVALPKSDFDVLARYLAQTNETCPLQITINSNEQTITKVTTSCQN